MRSFILVCLFVPLFFGQSNWWFANIQHQGKAVYADANYKVFRNVKDYGVRGDGTTDDTNAIQSAIADGGRCGQGCESSTVTPAILYFPPGTYIISKPVIPYYFTQIVGDALTLPVMRASNSFNGMALFDVDPYGNGGNNWWTNQNNFYRQIRNFVIDMRNAPLGSGTGIHWQVAQATSLQNIYFNCSQDKSDSNKHQGIWMENGSGGFMCDLIFNGGNFGAWMGNQQFTCRNLTFLNCKTGLYLNWNWVWTFKSITVTDCDIAVDISSGGSSDLGIGSLVLVDGKINNCQVGIKTGFTDNSNPHSANTLIVDNVDFSGTNTAIVRPDNSVVLSGGPKVSYFVQGQRYNSNSGADGNGKANAERFQGTATAPPRPSSLLGTNGYAERSKPQYTNINAGDVLSAKANGVAGDGEKDDTAALQALFDKSGTNLVLLDTGVYVVTNTVILHSNIRLTGECWPMVLASGNNFANAAAPIPLFQIGKSDGEVGNAELSDIVFATRGPRPGAILIKWMVHEASTASAGMWDVHTRIGGARGTDLEANCGKLQNGNLNCAGAFLLLQVTSKASAYLENNWFWVADHGFDEGGQLDIYNTRGVLIESQGPIWAYGTASEHSVLYNYQFVNAANIFVAVAQVETAYYQSTPNALKPFDPIPSWNDPTFTDCPSNQINECAKTWGLRIINSSNVIIYGAGFYSFFESYTQDCIDNHNCQLNMVSVDTSSTNIYILALSTIATERMVVYGSPLHYISEADNRDTYCSTFAEYRQ